MSSYADRRNFPSDSGQSRTSALGRGCVKTWAASVRNSLFLPTSHASLTEWTVAINSGVGCHCDAARYVVFFTT